MNIQEAKQDLINTVLAYTRRDAGGNLRIPQNKQRPVLLIGPPGIGKTAIMEQVAEECNVGLVAYTITHHTRQSAIGLPVIREKQYDGRTVSVTEYTMSEIIASVYDCMENTGKREGILFIDEINCVSETLAPAMLQFLQCKQFGSHQVPEGWVIAAAGNPAGFNKSVRDFDLVTLDRVRMLYIEEDLNVFFHYAHTIGVHDAILSFLEIKPQDFYRVEPWEHGTWFVTARGWEDLSRMLYAYEELGLEVTENFIGEFLQFPMIAGEFCEYYHFYNKFRGICPVPDILTGRCPAAYTQEIQDANHEERITLIHLLISLLREVTDASADSDSGLLPGYACPLKDLWSNAIDYLLQVFGYGMELTCFLREAEQSTVCAEYLRTAKIRSFDEVLSRLEAIKQRSDYEEQSRRLYTKLQ